MVLTPICFHATYSIQSRYGPDYFDYGRKTSEFGMLKFDIEAGRVVLWSLMGIKYGMTDSKDLLRPYTSLQLEHKASFCYRCSRV
jgi:hypothetical protein